MGNKEYKITIRLDKYEFDMITRDYEIEKSNNHKIDWYIYSFSKHIRKILLKHCLSKKSDNLENVGQCHGGKKNV